MPWLVVLILALWVVSADAATYHIATNGDDGRSCNTAQTIGTPRLTPRGGMDCLSAGDTLLIAPGTYGGTSTRHFIPPNRSGTSWDNVITVRGSEPTNRPIIRANLNLQDHAHETPANSFYWVFQDLIVDGSDNSNEGYNAIVSHDGMKLINVWGRNCTHSCIVTWLGPPYNSFDGFRGRYFINVEASGASLGGVNGHCPAGGGSDSQGTCHGMYLSGPNIVIDGGAFHDNEGQGIHPYQSPQAIVIKNSRFWNNGVGGIMLIGGAGPHEIFNNLFYHQRSIYPGWDAWGIAISTGGITHVYNNTFYDNDKGVDFNATIVLINNILYNNTQHISQNGGSLTQGNNLTGVDPLFANAPLGDFHLRSGSPAINMGANLGGSGIVADLEGLPRPEPDGTVYDIGAYECQNTAAMDCASEPPPPPVNGLVAEYKQSAADTSGNGFNATAQGGLLFNGAPLTSVNTASFVFDGINDAMTAPNDPAFRSASFCMVAWISSTIPPPPGGVCRLMSVGTTAVLGWGDTGTMLGYINNGPEVTGTINMLNGSTHLLGLSYDNTERILRGWFNNANFASTPVGAALVYSGSELLAMGGVTGRFCNARVNNFRHFNEACSPTGMLNIYREVPTIAPGSSSTHWRFYQSDAMEGTAIAGSGVDATDIVVARSSKVRQRWNVKRNGSTITEHFFTECNLNGGPFSTIDNSCAARPVCIAADSSRNMGDNTTNLLPNDGFNFVPGEFVVDTLNSSVTTPVPDGGVTEWETGYAFNQTLLADNDVVICRLRTGAGDFGPNGYPAVLPTMTISVPSGLAGGASMSGGTSQGGRRQ
jgi:hypothetical protein